MQIAHKILSLGSLNYKLPKISNDINNKTKKYEEKNIFFFVSVSKRKMFHPAVITERARIL